MTTGGINLATGQTFSNVDEVLKEFYLGPVREQLEFSGVLMKRAQKDKESVGGREVLIPVHTGRNEGIAGVSDGGSLPDPGAQSWENLTFPVKYMYGRLLITGPTISAAKTDKMAFVRTLDASIKGLTRDLKKELNRVCHGDGTGNLATKWTSPAGTGTITELGGSGQGTIVHAWDADSANKIPFIRPGMNLALVPTSATSSDKDSSTTIGGLTVTGVDTTNGTVSCSGGTLGTTTGWTASTDYYLVRAARVDSNTTSYSESSWYKEPMGLQGMITDTGTFQNVNASLDANDWWRAVVDSSTTALSFSTMQQMLDNIAKASEGHRPTLIITDYTQRRKYFELWGANETSGIGAARRYANTMVLDGGFEAVEYNGIPIVVDVDSTPGHMYFLHEPDIAIFRNEDFFWLDRDGKILHRLEDKDAYQATLACYYEYGAYRRNNQGVMNSLGE